MDSIKKSCELIRIAEIRISEGKYEEASKLIDEAISFSPSEQMPYSDAVNILLDGNLYGHAKEVFVRYRNETGKDLVTDFSYDEISQMERDSMRSFAHRPLNFKRMSMRERGHFSNLFSFWPVKEIDLSDEYISITRGRKKYTYRWQDVCYAKVVIKDAYKSYGTGTAAKFTQKTFVLQTQERSFQFDVSSNFPDFKNSSQLLAELLKRLDVQEVDLRKNASKVR